MGVLANLGLPRVDVRRESSHHEITQGARQYVHKLGDRGFRAGQDDLSGLMLLTVVSQIRSDILQVALNQLGFAPT